MSPTQMNVKCKTHTSLLYPNEILQVSIDFVNLIVLSWCIMNTQKLSQLQKKQLRL